VAEVYAVSGPEKGDVQATFRFANGASGTIAYLTGGNARFPKETLDATGGGCSARLDNFKSAAVWTGRGASTTKARGGQDKGQESEMAAFVEAVRTGAPMPIAVDSLLATTRATIAVGMSLLSGRPERV
jgi:predicted dehydrogenase